MPVLPDTFGDSWQCVYSYFAQSRKKQHTIQFYLDNGPCRAAHNCTDDEIMPWADSDELNYMLETDNPLLYAAFADKIGHILQSLDRHIYPTTHPVLSEGLEHRYTPEAQAHLHAFLRPLWPYELSTNPVAMLPPPPGVTLEFHTEAPVHVTPCIASEDGLFHTNSQSKRWMQTHSNCTRILWRAQHQGRVGTLWTPPKSRLFVIPGSDVSGLGALLK